MAKQAGIVDWRLAIQYSVALGVSAGWARFSSRVLLGLTLILNCRKETSHAHP